MTSLIIMGIIATIIVFLIVISYNGFIKTRNQSVKAFAELDKCIKKRWDLVCQAKADADGDTMAEIDRITSKPYEKLTVAEVLEANKALESIAGKLPASSELAQITEEIAASGKTYNDAARKNNQKVAAFPTSVIAKIFHFDNKPMFD